MNTLGWNVTRLASLQENILPEIAIIRSLAGSTF
jgi:hypothetical protein